MKNFYFDKIKRFRQEETVYTNNNHKILKENKLWEIYLIDI